MIFAKNPILLMLAMCLILLELNIKCQPPSEIDATLSIAEVSDLSDHPIVRNRQLNVIELRGSGYELGLQHGKKLKKEIDEIIGLWKENTSKALGKDASEVLDEFMEYANFEASIKKWTPELYAEVKGIAEGAGQKFEEVMVLNLLDEFWVYIDDPNNHHCSDVGIPARDGNPAMVAQNMDIEDYTDKYQVLFKISGMDGQPNQMVLSHPGLIALNGMNEEGLGVVVNTIMQLKAADEGVPVAFVVKKLISMTDKDEILQFINSIPHASGQSYIVGIDGEVYNFEASACKVVRHLPENQNDAVYHTNHPIVNTNLKPWHSDDGPKVGKLDQPTNSNSHIRFRAVELGMTEVEDIDEKAIMNILRGKEDPLNPVCRSWTGSGGFTFASTIMVLGEKPYMLITAGPPDETEYQTLNF
ncbi:C45 family autoproteolytic acyltransferase/hydolase [Portibacter marinus]|uniref:C45 family autoproteolytic acyltransferase/hydolase n=1 Tax=Portibacter marinus TaxID=2898660 RepID=UPI001F1EE5AC|nr:C45 family peptidase [Portibacter marinus]